MGVLAPLKPLAGFLVGAALGAALATVYDPVGVLMGGYRGWGAVGAPLSWAAAFGSGLLAARTAVRFEILVAALSVLAGAALVKSAGDPTLPLLDWHAVFYGGLYPIFAFFGGAAVHARRRERRGAEPSPR